MRHLSPIPSICRQFAILLAIVAALGPTARGELTVENLTGSAVSGVGPFYQDVQDAIKLFAEQDYPAALARLESAKKTTPRLAPAEVMMAQLYFDANQASAATAMLEQAIYRAPQDPEAYVLLAERASREGRLTEAGLTFAEAVKVLDGFGDNPKRKQALQLRSYTGWASVDERHANWKDARTKLEELVKLDPTSAAAHDRLARVLYRIAGNKSDQAAAYAEFKAAAEADKTMPPAELSMANLASDKVQAEKWLKFALEKHGDDLRTQLGAANFMMQSNQPEEAKVHAETALKLDPEGLETNVAMGLVARMLADYPTAAKHLSKAHLMAPGNSSIINNLALVLLELPDEASHQQALQFADLNARQLPTNAEVLATLGWVSYRLNRRKDAERAYTTVLTYLGTASGGDAMKMTPDMGYYMAHLAKEQNKIPKAIQLLKDALNNNQPFAYRIPAQEMLAQLQKLEQSRPTKAKGTTSSRGSQQAAKTDKAESAK
jgi:Tfp pilus assembly protein PilF